MPPCALLTLKGEGSIWVAFPPLGFCPVDSSCLLPPGHLLCLLYSGSALLCLCFPSWAWKLEAGGLGQSQGLPCLLSFRAHGVTPSDLKAILIILHPVPTCGFFPHHQASLDSAACSYVILTLPARNDMGPTTPMGPPPQQRPKSRLSWCCCPTSWRSEVPTTLPQVPLIHRVVHTALSLPG